ncbi:sensor histidine kinase [candidate division KSB1 bacterium]|nr:sensor histidine kinase [candidate division KSB1 bacterium]
MPGINNKFSEKTYFFQQKFASIGLICSLIIFIAILHYSTSTHHHQWHELYRVFFYIPIILAAFHFRLRGGIFAALGVIFIYIPHVIFQWGGDFWFNFGRFLEMIMYLIVGSVTGFLSQKQFEEQHRYQKVAEDLNRSYKELQKQSEKLAEIEEQLRTSERLAVIGELAANLAHEVRNPLGSIWGVVEILQEEIKADSKIAEFMQILVKEVQRLNQVVENHLNLSRKPTLVIKTCNLAEIVQSIATLLKSKARKENIDFLLNFPKDPILLAADESQLRQVLINLILNSMTAIERNGKITITGEIKTSNFPESTERLTQIQLSIHDTGVGIPADSITDIFKPFYTTRKDGTGLGLSIVKRIADQNNWKIQVNSQSGAGTNFTIIL